MVNVNDADRDVARDACCNHVNAPQAVAEYRERVEARVDAKWEAAKETWMRRHDAQEKRVVALELEAAEGRTWLERDAKRIAELEAQLRHESIDCDAWRPWARLLTGFADGSTDGGLRSGVESKYEAQLDAKHAKLVEVADKLAAANDRADNMRKALDAQLAAAKPVLTAEEEQAVRSCRSYGAYKELLAIIDRLCPPYKAPLTDAELADKIKAFREGGSMCLLSAAEDALRARHPTTGQR